MIFLLLVKFKCKIFKLLKNSSFVFPFLQILFNTFICFFAFLNFWNLATNNLIFMVYNFKYCILLTSVSIKTISFPLDGISDTENL